MINSRYGFLVKSGQISLILAAVSNRPLKSPEEKARCTANMPRPLKATSSEFSFFEPIHMRVKCKQMEININ